MDDLFELGLFEGQWVSLVYEDGSQQAVEIERTRITNGLVGVVATPAGGGETYNILVDTSNGSAERSRIPVYREASLPKSITKDHVPEPPLEAPHKWIVSANGPDTGRVEMV